MSPFLSTAEKAFLALNRGAVILALAAMACLVFANVMLRFFTNNSIVWAEEVARYLMIYMTFLSAGLALRGGLLVAVSQIHLRLPQGAARLLRGAMLLVLLVFCGWMIWSGLEYVSRMGRQVTPATRISFSHIYRAMPIGFGLLMIHILLVSRHFVTQGRFDAETHEHGSAVGG
ncbi:MAG: TRAP transporter small permease [Cereibacter changlensis]